MIVLTDDRVVSILSTKFSIAANRIIYGQLEYAKNYWVRYTEENAIQYIHPFMTFYHLIRFDENNRQCKYAEVTIPEHTIPGPTPEDEPVVVPESQGKVRFTPCVIEYTVEIVGNNVVDQVEYIRKYFFWINGNACIIYTDADGQEWNFKVTGDDPEDNSDLEAEEETGRVVRTTFNFRVDTFILENSSATGYITEILQNIHLYYNNISESVLVDETVIKD